MVLKAPQAPGADSQQGGRGSWPEQRAGCGLAPCGWQDGGWLGGGSGVARKQQGAASRARRQLRRKPWWGDPVVIERSHLFWAGN